MFATRRDFLRQTAAAAVAGSALSAFAADEKPAGDAKPQKILILGGTGFLGPHVVEHAKKRGHTLTLFNRGKTNPHLFPDIEKLHGDRTKEDGLKPLAGRSWDAVVDTSAYFPRAVRMATERLKDTKLYVFVSTMSVYADTSKPGMDESTAIGKIEDENEEKVTGASYGPLKALCEQAAEKGLPGRVANLRPGLIVGPGDTSDRFTYWPVRVQRGGEMLAPGTPADPVQFIDVRDLAEFIVLAIERRIVGVYNTVGPKNELGIGALLDACKAVAKSDARFTWVDAEFLAEQKVSPWGDMPVWVPPVGDSAGFARSSSRRAIEKGLAFRPLGETLKDTLAWWKTLPPERQAKLRAGIAPEREKEILAAWAGRGKKS